MCEVLFLASNGDYKIFLKRIFSQPLSHTHAVNSKLKSQLSSAVTTRDLKRLPKQLIRKDGSKLATL
jgi:hypothetical protein